MKTIIALAALLSLTSCVCNKYSSDDGKKTIKDITVKPFSKINITSSANVYFVQGDTTSVRLKGGAKSIDNIIIKNSGDALVITRKTQKGINVFNMSSTGKVDIYITSPNLRGVKITGSGDFEAAGHIDTDKIDINITGSGDADLGHIICNSAALTVTGSGDIDIKELRCGSSKTNISGSGNIEFQDLQADDSRFNVSGSGDIDVKNARIKNGSCEVRGSGTISINGKVDNLQKHVFGSGGIHVY